MAHETSQFLVKLSEACKKHAAFHTNVGAGSSTSSSSSSHPSSSPSSATPSSSSSQPCAAHPSGEHAAGGDASDGVLLADKCRRELCSLSTLIPQLELSYSNSQSEDARNETTATRAMDVSNICGFYRSILGRVYCPHSPRLFGDQRHAHKVLLRVFFLLKQLTTPCMQRNMRAVDKKSLNSKESTDDGHVQLQRPPAAVADTVVDTICSLLAFIDESNIQNCILQDMLLLGQDLAVLQEHARARVNQHASRSRSVRGGGTGSGGGSGGIGAFKFPSAEIAILDETLAYCEAQDELETSTPSKSPPSPKAAATTTPATATATATATTEGTTAKLEDPIRNTEELPEEFVLYISNQETLSMLRYCTFNILRSLLKLKQHRAKFCIDDLPSIEVANGDAPSQEEREAARQRLSFDAPSTMFTDMMAMIRSAALLPIPQMPKKRAASPASKKVTGILSTHRVSISAVLLLECMLDDWESSNGSPIFSELTEMSILVARILNSTLSDGGTNGMASDVTKPFCFAEYYFAHVRKVAQMLFFQLPTVKDEPSIRRVNDGMCLASLPYLCGCIGHTSASQITSISARDGNRYRAKLIQVVLQVMHRFSMTSSSPSRFVCKQITGNAKAVTALTELACDPTHHHVATLILNTLVRDNISSLQPTMLDYLRNRMAFIPTPNTVRTAEPSSATAPNGMESTDDANVPNAGLKRKWSTTDSEETGSLHVQDQHDTFLHERSAQGAYQSSTADGGGTSQRGHHLAFQDAICSFVARSTAPFQTSNSGGGPHTDTSHVSRLELHNSNNHNNDHNNDHNNGNGGADGINDNSSAHNFGHYLALRAASALVLAFLKRGDESMAYVGYLCTTGKILSYSLRRCESGIDRADLQRHEMVLDTAISYALQFVLDPIPSNEMTEPLFQIIDNLNTVIRESDHLAQPMHHQTMGIKDKSVPATLQTLASFLPDTPYKKDLAEIALFSLSKQKRHALVWATQSPKDERHCRIEILLKCHHPASKRDLLDAHFGLATNPGLGMSCFMLFVLSVVVTEVEEWKQADDHTSIAAFCDSCLSVLFQNAEPNAHPPTAQMPPTSAAAATITSLTPTLTPASATGAARAAGAATETSRPVLTDSNEVSFPTIQASCAMIQLIFSVQRLDTGPRALHRIRQLLQCPASIQRLICRGELVALVSAEVPHQTAVDAGEALLLGVLRSLETQIESVADSNRVLQRWKWLALVCNSLPLIHDIQVKERLQSALLWLLETALLHPDPEVCLQTSWELGKLVATPPYRFLQSALRHQSKMEEADPAESMGTTDTVNTLEVPNQVVAAFFMHFDSIATRKKRKASDPSMNSGNLAYMAYTQCLTSISQQCRSSDQYGRQLLSNAMQRLVICFGGKRVIRRTANVSTSNVAASGDLLNDRFQIEQKLALRSIIFANLTRLDMSSAKPGSMICEDRWNSLPKSIFNALLSSTGRLEYDARTRVILNFMRYPMLRHGYERTLPGASHIFALTHFIEEMIPSVLSRSLADTDYDALVICLSMRELLVAKEKQSLMSKKFSTSMLCGRSALQCVDASNVPVTTSLARKKIRNLTIGPNSNLIERVIPSVLRDFSAHSRVLNSFCQSYLYMETPDVMQEWEKPILKRLIWGLGDVAGASNGSGRALHSASLLLFGSSSGNLGNTSMDQKMMVSSSWVSKHFLFLLVNILQLKWKDRSTRERFQSLLCLHNMLDYLVPAEAGVYFQQMISIVSVATEQVELAGDANGKSHECYLQSEICILSAKALARFITIVAEQQLSTIAQNLTIIIATLIGIMATSTKVSLDASAQCATTIVDLLAALSSGDLGEGLSKYFDEVPFLATAPELEDVRQSLQQKGIVFASFNVPTSSSADRDGSHHKPHDDTSSIVSESSLKRPEQLRQFQHCIASTVPLIQSENVGVRRATLQHLGDLLFNNRALFRAILSEERSVTTSRFLTIRFTKEESRQGTNAEERSIPERGAITELIENLLRRCKVESDSRSRLLLALCLGEIGAISEDQLGDIRISEGFDDTLEASETDTGTWRLAQPPWRSRDIKYQLYLVTKLLVDGLRSASDLADQHKIAFAIQELLILLDLSANSQGREVVIDLLDRPDDAEMSPWLQDQLRKAGVLDAVEPFWSSKFHEKTDRFVMKQPPFFKTSRSYFHWLSSFCRWMIARANETASSNWKAMFNACRAAVRSRAGLPVSEFILPLLILDRMCFGNSHEINLMLTELRDALNFHAHPCIMDFADCQRSVNSVFAVFDTLHSWMQAEVEKRYAASCAYGGNDSRATSGGDGSATMWPADAALHSIDDLIDAISLESLAIAAGKAGMYAKAQQLWERQARKRCVEANYNSRSSSKSIRKSRSRRGCLVTANHMSQSNWEQMTEVLSQLDDHETMMAIHQQTTHMDAQKIVRENIRLKETSGDWEGALQEYERAMQLEMNQGDGKITAGMLRCLVELGHFESALNHLYGVTHQQQQRQQQQQQQHNEENDDGRRVHAFAAEAAWRLGRWDTLSDLVGQHAPSNATAENAVDEELSYRIETGRAMLALKESNSDMLSNALDKARESVLASLSRAAQESYTRCYSHLVHLHCLREIEEAAKHLAVSRDDGTPDASMAGLMTTSGTGSLISELSEASCAAGGGWNDRLDVVSPRDAQSVISTRLALARIASEPLFEVSLFATAGKRARKLGLHNIAATNLTQAELLLSSKGREADGTAIQNLFWPIESQVAELKHAAGMSSAALQTLGQDEMMRVVEEVRSNSYDDTQLRSLAIHHERARTAKFIGVDVPSITNNDPVLTNRFAARLLKMTRWMVEGGLKGGREVREMFEFVHGVEPTWEKGHFHFAKYIDGVLQGRLDALVTRAARRNRVKPGDDESHRSRLLLADKMCQEYTLLAMRHYSEALISSGKHLYQALPRLLSLWFTIMSAKSAQDASMSSGSSNNSNQSSGRHGSSNMGSNHSAANSPTSERNDNFSQCQQEANQRMSTNIRQIPQILFYTAIPQLISRVIHDNNMTSKIVQKILQRVLTRFPQQAMWPLAWLRGSRDSGRKQIGVSIFKAAQTALSRHKTVDMEGLLSRSADLFKYLQTVAKFKAPDRSKSTSFRARPWQSQDHLCEFVPPVKAALNVSSLLSLERRGSRDYFPRIVPRMRKFCEKVGMMSSKARPKRLRALMVPGTIPRSASQRRLAPSQPEQDDIGELHFLLKQEAKGDLRKDARVQDLANVINRLMVASISGNGKSRARYLQLRTFAVTCLSEDIGILEWVPNTDSMRNLVNTSYNPQANSSSSKRRGNTLSFVGEGPLRSSFVDAQNVYFKKMKCQQAIAMFIERCLAASPPLLYWWFVHKFHDPHMWYEARIRFTLSVAVWSGVGHVLGLGDRHAENILVDTTSGACVHVDFDCIFDKGLSLPKPEVVPFRLSPNMVDAFGPTAEEGMFKIGLQTVMATLRDNRDTLLSVLEPFVKDPVIDWKRQRQQSANERGAGDENARNVVLDQTQIAAKQSINVIDERLQGIYNLRNPNIAKLQRSLMKRTGGIAPDQDYEEEHTHIVPLSVEAQVHKMISEASSPENLLQMFVGWMSWV